MNEQERLAYDHGIIISIAGIRARLYRGKYKKIVRLIRHNARVIDVEVSP
jgi:hypothetical protein